MEKMDTLQRISELEREIAALPQGSLTMKKIKGKEYYYHRLSANGKRSEIYIESDAAAALRTQIEKRKELEAELKQLRHAMPKAKSSTKKKDTHEFHTSVRIGEQLQRWIIPAKNFKRRECYSKLYEYVFGDCVDKVFVLYGLRRTGKTTLIRQIALDMTSEQMEKAAFIQVKSSDTLAEINTDLKYLEQEGYTYVFIDEVTLISDFIEGAALFSDIYASSGMKIVLSGTDSLGFIFAKSAELYDRCIMLHTTIITYREFERVLGIKGIDEYIRYGGTMSIGGVHYNDASSFATKRSTDEYVDTAIAHNIQHSLEYYQDGGHFRHLYELYDQGELTGAINRVVEDINHRFTRDVLTRTFRSATLSTTARNLLKDREAPFELMANIDHDSVLASIRKLLDILEKEEQTVEVSEVHAYQIREYLLLLDLVMEIDQLHLPDVNARDKKTIISQPGLRYAQVKAHIDALMMDEKFAQLSIVERTRVVDRVMSTIQGRMMEDIVLLETKLANPRKQVFQLQFPVGEFDMVVFAPDTLSCAIYEIKHSTEIVAAQYQHLIDIEKCAACEHRYGTITGRYVIYRGENASSEGIQYLNVEEYLKSLG